MTNKDLLVQIVNEVTHEDREVLTIKATAIMRGLEKIHPGSTQPFDMELNSEEAEMRLGEMRQQQIEIMEWFTWQFDVATWNSR